MVTWQTNLFQNLIVIFVLMTLAIIIYAKVSGKTLPEIIRDIKEVILPNEQI